MILNVFNSDINFASILNSMTIKFNKKFSNLWRFIFLFDDDVFKKSKELGILFDENSGIILFLLWFVWVICYCLVSFKNFTIYILVNSGY